MNDSTAPARIVVDLTDLGLFTDGPTPTLYVPADETPSAWDVATPVALGPGEHPTACDHGWLCPDYKEERARYAARVARSERVVHPVLRAADRPAWMVAGLPADPEQGWMAEDQDAPRW